MDNGIKIVPNASVPENTLQTPTRLPPPAFVNHGRPLVKNEHGPATNAHRMAEPEPVVEPVVAPTVEDAAAKRQQRKEEWSMAERARQMEASANEKLKKSAAYEAAVANFDKDPLALAKILGLSVPDLLDKMQRAAFSMPTEKVLTPEETYKLKTMEYEKEIQQIKQQQIFMNNKIIKDNFNNKTVMPELVKNPDKYEISLADIGADAVASYVTDYIADHLLQTGKELNPVDVLEAFEAELEEKYRGNATKLRNVKKFKDIFAAQEAAKEEAAADLKDAKKIPAATVAVSDNETDLTKLITPRTAKSKVSVVDDSGPSNTIVKKGNSREERLARMRAERAARGE